MFFATSPKTLREFIQKANFKTDYLFLITSYGSDGDQNALMIMKECDEIEPVICYTIDVMNQLYVSLILVRIDSIVVCAISP